MLELEVQQRHHNHRLQIVVPSEFLLSSSINSFRFIQVPRLSSLCVDRIGCVVQGPFPEILLISLLHLDDECPSIGAFTGNVKDHLSVFLGQAQMFGRDEINALDLHILQHHVKEPDQHILVGLAAEHPLEHEVAQQVCVRLFLASRLLLFFCFFHAYLI